MGEGLPTEPEMTQRQLLYKAPLSTGDSSKNLGSCSIPHSLQAAQQIGECPFQPKQLF